MNIIIPMMGQSSRFKNEGFGDKYRLPVGSRSLFSQSLLSFRKYFSSATFFFVFPFDREVEGFVDSECEILGISSITKIQLAIPTRGQAHTVAIACEKISDDKDIIIFNIDTIRLNFIAPIFQPSCIGWIEVFKGSGNQWSYARVDEDGFLVEAAEKQEISELASNGMYGFLSAREYLNIYLEHYGSKKQSSEIGEEYIAPMFNTAVKAGRVRVFITPVENNIFSGTPSEYLALIRNDEIINRLP